MKESLEKLFKKMNEDKAFAESILTQNEKEKVIELAKAEGINLYMADIDEANTVIQKTMQVQKLQSEGELSEEELESVAGGIIGIDDIITLGALTIVIGIFGASAVASAVVTGSISGGITAGITASINAFDQ